MRTVTAVIAGRQCSVRAGAARVLPVRESRGPVNARAIVFEGLGAVECTQGAARLIVVHEIGPRIAWYGPRSGGNLLFWDRERALRRGAWTLFGGHRLWTTRPDADESEESYEPDDRPCRVRIAPSAVTVTAAPDRRGLARAIRLRADARGFAIEHRITNVGDMLWAGGLWALTCTVPRPTTAYAIPLGDDSRWDVVTIVTPRRWGGDHTSRVDDPQIELGRDHLRLRPRGVETKRMVRAPRGIVAMSDRRTGVGFVKQARFEPAGAYPLDTNVALYLAPRSTFVEMETMGPMRRLAPGENAVHVERWTLQRPIDWVHARG